jgi:hypothetical protein
MRDPSCSMHHEAFGNKFVAHTPNPHLSKLPNASWCMLKPGCCAVAVACALSPFLRRFVTTRDQGNDKCVPPTFIDFKPADWTLRDGDQRLDRRDTCTPRYCDLGGGTKWSENVNEM